MTTPNVTSPNVRIVPKELLVQPPEDAPLSTTPIAEAALAELLQGGRLGIRDMYRPVDALPEIITDDARSKWDALAEDVADGAESARMLLADWWRHGWAQTFQRPPFWVRPAAAPDPGAHPYPAPEAEPVTEEPAPVAEPEPEPAAGEPEPATDATAVPVDIAGKQEAAKGPDDATAVMEPPTQIVPAVEKDGGESDDA